VFFLPDLSERSVDALLTRIHAERAKDAITIVSIHWGSNWGHEIPPAHVAFARRLIDGGVDFVHGHSSHHPRAMEVYRGRLVLYGCGDFVNDYEGIGGHERYRGDLRLMYFPTLAEDGRLLRLRIFVLQSHRLRLRLASREDVHWLAADLDRASHPFATRLLPGEAGDLELRLPPLRTHAGRPSAHPFPRPPRGRR
jgi:poly-gamma-glutamate synthesis protein (capsule biosynthesis protein)